MDDDTIIFSLRGKEIIDMEEAARRMAEMPEPRGLAAFLNANPKVVVAGHSTVTFADLNRPETE